MTAADEWTAMSELRMVPPDEARELLEAATPGPWHFATAPHPDSTVTKAEYVADALRDDHSTLWTTWAADPERGEDDYLIPALTGDGPAAGANAALVAAAPDLAHTAVVLGEQRPALEHLLRTLIKTLARVRMDTPEDKALHAKAIEMFWEAARALGVSE